MVAVLARPASDATIYPRDGFDYWVYHDPGPPSLLGGATAEDYLDGFEMVALWSSHLDPSDGVLWDISPKRRRATHRFRTRASGGPTTTSKAAGTGEPATRAAIP